MQKLLLYMQSFEASIETFQSKELQLAINFGSLEYFKVLSFYDLYEYLKAGKSILTLNSIQVNVDAILTGSGGLARISLHFY